ncbi:MAG: glycoside hydrolase family 1 protein [Chloroflexi bacterium]|nr:glycoside hydrolase family 1 protein [Chloroflexota bacterium]
MPTATFQFPAGFLWGTATAAHQVEGHNTNNNWSAWEEEPGHILNGQRAGAACDWWGGRWKEDLDRAAAGGQNAHRMSIEWSRIQPEPGRWDEDALEHYRMILRGMLQRKLTPMITLHHFTDPLWLTAQGGWENDETPAQFARFVEKAVEALKEYNTLWVTINEPNVYATSGYVSGDFPPGKQDLAAAFQVLLNMVRGHALAYRAIHRLQPEARVGVALNYRGFQPAHPGNPLDAALVRFLAHNFNASFLEALSRGRFRYALRSTAVPEAVKTQDFVGINYYTTDLVAFDLSAYQDLFHRRFYPGDAVLSENGFIRHTPQGLFEALHWGQKFGLPLLVTENGVEDSQDGLRPRYIAEHLHQLWRAINFNWQIKGYFHWSQVDNFEWERGWSQRFGLWGLDVDTQTRIHRPSVDLYTAVCKSNALSSETVQQYAPAAYPALFPG